jgi:hypothetical protein
LKKYTPSGKSSGVVEISSGEESSVSLGEPKVSTAELRRKLKQLQKVWGILSSRTMDAHSGSPFQENSGLRRGTSETRRAVMELQAERKAEQKQFNLVTSALEDAISCEICILKMSNPYT